MGRLIGAVLLGYLVIAVVVFAGLSLAWVALGADRAFRPGVYDVSTLWVLLSLAVGLGAAVLGGWVARRIAGTATGPRVLAAIVVVLGIVMALPALSGTPDAAGVRGDAVGMLEATQVAQTPVWVLLLNPLIGAIGVLVGGGALRVAGARAVHDDVPAQTVNHSGRA